MLDFKTEVKCVVKSCFHSKPTFDSNGIVRGNYLNGHKLLSFPRVLQACASEILDDIESSGAQYVAGLAYGGCLLAGAVALESLRSKTPIQPIIIRDKPKAYGGAGILTYPIPTNSEIYIVDDVISTGGSAQKAVELIQANGHRVVGFSAAVRRGKAGVESIEQHGIAVSTLTSISELSRL